MARFVKYEPCPRCSESGRDRSGDNLAVYDDGSAFCFARCGYKRSPKFWVPKVKETNGNENKAVLPRDFTREVPARAWKWLLQYGLSYRYWQPFVGWSEESSRLVFTVGNPTLFSIGRYIGDSEGEAGGVRKWWLWGDSGNTAIVLGGGNEGPVVLVEDLISAHKVAQVATAIPLFGTKVHDCVLRALMGLKRPVALWLDADQLTLLVPKINRVQTFLTHPVRYIHTERDPKKYSLNELKEILNV